jgi:hypothetical protein
MRGTRWCLRPRANVMGVVHESRRRAGSCGASKDPCGRWFGVWRDRGLGAIGERMTRTPAGPDLLHDIYIDESSQTQNRFLILGGLIVPTKHVGAFDEYVRRTRLPELPHGEMKWTKVSPTKLAAYQRVTKAVLRPPPGPFNLIEFHSLAVDTHKLKDKVFNSGSREVGFNKEIFQLCQKFGRIHRFPLFHVYLDQRNTSSSTDELRNILNRGVMLKQPERDWPYRRLHFRDSSKCQSLQIVDIMIGAIAFRLNGHYAAPGASLAKRELSDHVLSLVNVRDVTRDTRVRGRFTIWHRQLR